MVGLKSNLLLFAAIAWNCSPVIGGDGVDVLPLYVEGTRIWTLKNLLRSEVDVDDTCFQVGQQCSSDCLTIMTCIGKPSPLSKKLCTSTNSQTPYCVNNICTDQPDSANPNCDRTVPPPPFKCTSEGIFPDPANCSRYHYCPKVQAEDWLYECPAGYVFDSVIKLCKLRKSDVDCQLIDCTSQENNNEMILFQPNPAYYAFCYGYGEYAGAADAETIVFKCENDSQDIYDLALQQCVYNCKSEGVFSVGNGCNGYVRCMWQNERWITAREYCPPNYYFIYDRCAQDDYQDFFCKQFNNYGNNLIDITITFNQFDLFVR